MVGSGNGTLDGGGGSSMNVDKPLFLNVDKRSKVNILNVGCARAAFVSLGHRFV